MATLRPAVEKLASTYRLKLKQISDLKYRIKTMQLNTSYYNQLGLLYHDVIDHSPLTAEAVRRLPREESEARDFRISRAFNLAGGHAILPREQWTTIEQDIPYLNPYMEIISKEWRDKADWDNFVNPKDYP